MSGSSRRVNPEGHKLKCGEVWVKATNNAIEYKVLLVDLRVAKEMQVKSLLISSDFQLIAIQINGNFTIRDNSMAVYLKLVMGISHPSKNLS